MKTSIGVGAVGLIAAMSILPGIASGASIDSRFGNKGIAEAKLTLGSNAAGPTKALAIAANGKIVVLGNEEVSDLPGGRSDQMVLARFSSSGRVDRTFGADGLVYGSRLPASSKWDSFGYGQDLSVLANRGVLVTGPEVPTFSGLVSGSWLNDCAFVARFSSVGKLDRRFGRNGKSTQCLDLDEHHRVGLNPLALSVSGKGRLLVGGEVLDAGRRTAPFVARFTVRGFLDRRFRGNRTTRSGERGILRLGRPGKGRVTETLPTRRGGVLAIGSLGGQALVSKLRPDGSLDPDFGHQGSILRDVDGSPRCDCTEATGMAFDRAGRITVVGTWTKKRGSDHPKLFVLRVNKNGHAVRSFGRNGVMKPALDRDFEATSVAIQRDGKVVIGGSSADAKKGRVFGLVRIKASGPLDRSFFDHGVFAPGLKDLGVSATDVILDDRGRILGSGVGDQDLPVIRIKPN